jgi:hypothetical protein
MFTLAPQLDMFTLAPPLGMHTGTSSRLRLSAHAVVPLRMPHHGHAARGCILSQHISSSWRYKTTHAPYSGKHSLVVLFWVGMQPGPGSLKGGGGGGIALSIAT